MVPWHKEAGALVSGQQLTIHGKQTGWAPILANYQKFLTVVTTSTILHKIYCALLKGNDPRQQKENADKKRP